MARPKDTALHARRREEILAAAARVFKAKGFHLARTEDICAEAGLSAGTLFRHFPDKRAVIVAIAESELQHYQAELDQLATRDGLRWMATLTADQLDTMLAPKAYDLGTDSWLELSRDPAMRTRLLASDARLRETLRRELERGQAEGWVHREIDCAGCATLILALFSGLGFDRELGVATDSQHTARAIADLFNRFIAP